RHYPPCSNQIRKGSLSTPEIGDSDPKKDRDNSQAHEQTRHIELTLAAEKTPTEAIDNADDGIEAIPESPLLGDHCARKTYRRHVQAHLDDERNNVAKVAVLHIQSGDQECRPETCKHRQG